MKKASINLVPDVVNPTPDYYCTWQTQLYATSDGKSGGQRKAMCENSLFNPEKPYGWAYFYEDAKRDLFIVMDDSWDVPYDNNEAYHGSLILCREKFPGFVTDTDSGLKALTDKIKSLGWKGLGGWVCPQESSVYSEGKTVEEYWLERIKAAGEAGLSYWKVDWGTHDKSLEFRKMLTDVAREHAPCLCVEHSIINDAIPHGDTFRTYDVPALLSIPMTIEKLCNFCDAPAPIGENLGLINCEDEAYMAAAGGYAMGIMRHPYRGEFPDGRADMSFPAVHRDLKTKIAEVTRAARYHRIAPAFGGGTFIMSDEFLTDTWNFEKPEEEIEAWWSMNGVISEGLRTGTVRFSARAAVARNTSLPNVEALEGGEKAFCIASLNPNGVYSVATLGRTVGRYYGIPKCDVTVRTGDADTVGVFGEYNTLTLETDRKFEKVLLQDLAGDCAYDITEDVTVEKGKLTIPGEIISAICKENLPEGDTSEPGAVLRLG